MFQFPHRLQQEQSSLPRFPLIYSLGDDILAPREITSSRCPWQPLHNCNLIVTIWENMNRNPMSDREIWWNKSQSTNFPRRKVLHTEKCIYYMQQCNHAQDDLSVMDSTFSIKAFACCQKKFWRNFSYSLLSFHGNAIGEKSLTSRPTTSLGGPVTDIDLEGHSLCWTIEPGS